MRHRKRRTRFGRQPVHRAATLKALARAVFLHQCIKTTRVKAKEARRLVEKLITVAKEDTLSARRKAISILGDSVLVSKLFKEIAPLFAKRKSGYTRIIPFGFRIGDGADMVFLELTEKKPEEKPLKKARKAERATTTKAVKKEVPPARPKAAPELKREVKEEKTVEEIKRTKAKDETRKLEKQKTFLKKVRGFFRRRTNM